MFVQTYQKEKFNLETVEVEPYIPKATASFALIEKKGPQCKLCGAGHVWFRCTEYQNGAQKVKRAQ